MPTQSTSVVAVDWGTSQLRLWPLDRAGKKLACHRSNQGMRVVERDEFPAILEAQLEELGLGFDVPVIMCGMVGSRQGWQEAPYLKTPAHINSVVDGAVSIAGTKRDMRILPGMAKYDPVAPDVMRSEETQLLGLHHLMSERAGGLVCMPGSHAKWVRFENGIVTDFMTTLSGELFAALGSSSVLKHALEKADKHINAQSDAFTDAVTASLEEPATIFARLFATRPQNLLNDASADDAAARISGSIIGQDIAGAVSRFAPMRQITLVGSGHLGILYQAALELAGLNSTIVDGDELAIAGLSRAAQLLWPERFEADAQNIGLGT